MSDHTVHIVVEESGSEKAADNILKIPAAAREAEKGVVSLERGMKQLEIALAAVGLTMGIKEILALSESYVQITNTLQLASRSAEELADKQRALHEIAIETRQSYDGVANTFISLEQATRGLGVSTQQLEGVTSSVAKALTVSHKSADDANQAMSRLALALRTGATDARAFQSLFLTFPELADAVGQAMGRSGAQIREMMKNGEISTRQLIDALARAGEAGSELDRRFKGTEITLSGAIRNIRTELELYVGKADLMSGTTHVLAQGLEFIAQHMNVVVPLVRALTTAIIVFGAVAGAAYFNIQALMLALAVNKWAIIFAAVSALVSLFISFGNEIKLTSDGSVTALSAVVGVFRILGAIVQSVGTVVQAFYRAVAAGNPIAVGAAVALGVLTLGFSRIALVLTVGFFAGIIGGLIGMARNIALLVAAIAPLIIEIAALAAVTLATTALITKMTDALGITTGAYDRFATFVNDGLTKLQKVTQETFEKGSEQAKAWAAQFNTSADDITRGTETVAKAHGKMADDVGGHLHHVTTEAERARQRWKDILKAMGQDAASLSIVVDQSTKGMEKAFDEMTVKIIEDYHKLAKAQTDYSGLASEENLKNNKKQEEEVDKFDQGVGRMAQSFARAADNMVDRAVFLRTHLQDIGHEIADIQQTMDGLIVHKKQGDISLGFDPLQRLTTYQSVQMGDLDALNAGDQQVAARLKRVYDSNLDMSNGTNMLMNAAGITALLKKFFPKDPNLARFASGGSFMVGGSGGIDTTPVSFMATKGEKVTVQTPEQQRTGGGINVHMTVVTDNAASFDRSRPQIIAALHSELTRARLQGQ